MVPIMGLYTHPQVFNSFLDSNGSFPHQAQYLLEKVNSLGKMVALGNPTSPGTNRLGKGRDFCQKRQPRAQILPLEYVL